MAEQTFKSPGFFEREIEVISRPLVRNTDVPAGIIGPAEKGPAFVPTTVSSATEFFKKFGLPDKNRTAAHAVSEFFSSQGRAATFCRILGTGTSAGNGDVGFAGFKLTGTELTDLTNQNRAKGAVQFISAARKAAAVSVVKNGLPVPAAKITTRAFSIWRMARRRI